jgi:(2Fe-2S) ferredoxin
MGQYRFHLFVCTTGKTCRKEGAENIKDMLKKSAKASGLGDMIRVNEAGCMNQCGHGPMVVVYPEDIWYARVDEEGARRIMREHVLGGTPVESYRHVVPPGDNKLK